MNILHIAYSLSESSAATRLAYAQYLDGHNVYFLLGKNSSYNFVKERQLLRRTYIVFSFISKVLYKIVRICSGIAKDEVFTFDILDFYNVFLFKLLIMQYHIDILHFHWCGAGFFSINAIIKLNNHRIVITFHDYHLATGGCHIPMECETFSSCNNCPLIPKYSIFSNLFYQVIKRRKKLFYTLVNRQNIRFISPSKYTYCLLSKDIQVNKHYLIGNAISKSYQQVASEYLKNNFEVNIQNNSILLFIGVKKSKRDNKGFLLMSKLIEIAIKENWPVSINFVACDIPDTISTSKSINYNRFNYLDDKKMIEMYALADLCVLPSKYETFSQVCLESIICGTPVIAFDHTGPRDILGEDFPFFLVPSFEEVLFIKRIFNFLFYKRENFLSILKNSDNICRKYSAHSIATSHSIVYNSFESI